MKLCPACNKTYAEEKIFCPVDGEVLQESPESFVGRVIDGKYRVEGFIAQGGMGAVYRARHILLGDEVAIKTLRSEMRNNAELLRRFQREGKAARAFRHPNAVTVYDLSSGSDGQVYMVMEYVEGHTLERELKRRGRFTPAEALEVLEPVGDVLDAAHARGVVHRDLKPENIMLGSDGRGGTVVKVLDLGIAKLTGAADLDSTRVTTSLTMAGQILGTPYYMSPEQWGEVPRDGNPEVDGRTDVYSLGIIFFELVAGKKPLCGTTLSELRQKHVAAPLPPLSEVAPEVPEAFGHAVARATSKDRNDRPRTAGAFVGDLRASLGLAPSARKTGADSPVNADAERRTGAGDAATTHLAHDAGAEPGHVGDVGVGGNVGDVGRAETILTEEFEAPTSGRATGARGARQVTSENVGASREGGRETLAQDAGETDGGAAGSPPRRAAEESRHHAADAHEAARHIEAARHGAGVSVTAPETKRPRAPLVLGGALALLLVVGVGGWLAWKGRPAKPPTHAAAETPRPPAPSAAPKVEAASYWFETFESRNDAAGERVAEVAPSLASGKWFKFHFTTRQRGYLYIIGPYKDGNAQVTILTAQGAGELKSNLVGAGADFSFPFGGTKLHLDDNPGADEFTFIFSPTPLMSPAFLAGKYLHELSPAEVRELEDLRARYKADAPEVSARGEGAERRVGVLAPEPATDAGRPLIFDVRIDHR